MRRENETGFGLLPFRSPLLRKFYLVSFPPGNEMFYFPGYASCLIDRIPTEVGGFPHSEISGSKVARHLPEAYRSFATSFIATFSQGIHRTPLNFLLRNLKTTNLTKFKKNYILTAQDSNLVQTFSCLGWEKTLKRPTGFQFSIFNPTWFFNKKTAFWAAYTDKRKVC